ncbi:hypothetical protein PVJ1_00009 [Psychrobacillus phage PVJ1]|nr:hypothetical protein PVJ1_00009 [Psychrobacillus phage PVJ1]
MNSSMKRRAEEKLIYLRNLSPVNGNIVKKAKVDKHDPLVKRIVDRHKM